MFYQVLKNQYVYPTPVIVIFQGGVMRGLRNEPVDFSACYIFDYNHWISNRLLPLDNN
jgi:hypothetical protein